MEALQTGSAMASAGFLRLASYLFKTSVPGKEAGHDELR
jgi:hypothetical protein